MGRSYTSWGSSPAKDTEEADPEAMTPKSAALSRQGSSAYTGNIRVKVIAAENLKKPSGNSIFRAQVSGSPYAVVYIEDINGAKSTHRRTQRQKHTLNPKWNTTFNWSVKDTPDNLKIHVEVYHQEQSEGSKGRFYGKAPNDIFMGKAELCLDDLLRNHKKGMTSLGEHNLVLTDSNDEKAGSIMVAVHWMQNAGFAIRTSNVAATGRYWAEALNSPQALRIVFVGQIGFAGLLLLVASCCRWLCKGTSLQDCEDMPVAGTVACTFLGAMSALFVMVVNFLGASGALGVSWTTKKLSLLDLLERDNELHEDGFNDANEEPMVMVKVSRSAAMGELGAKLALATNFCSSSAGASAATAVRLLCMLLYLAAMGMCALALFLVYLRRTQVEILGEAVYLDGVALLCFFGGVLTSLREHNMMALLQRERFHMQSQTQRPDASPSPSHDFFDDITSKARGFAQDFQNTLSTPLLEHKERFQSNVNNKFKKDMGLAKGNSQQFAVNGSPDLMQDAEFLTADGLLVPAGGQYIARGPDFDQADVSTGRFFLCCAAPASSRGVQGLHGV